MQVNNMSSQNFGMALKIKPEAMSSLKNASIDTLKKIDRIGDELKDTKYYHLELGENLTPRITSPYANKYLPPFDPQTPSEFGQDFLKIPATWDGTEIYSYKKGKPETIYLQYESKEAALEAYNRITKNVSSLERGAELTKELDKREIKRVAKETAERAERKEAENIANDLFKKFGIDE